MIRLYHKKWLFLLFTLLITYCTTLQAASKGESNINIWAHLFSNLKIIDDSSDLNIYASVGLQYKFIFFRTYHDFQYKNHFVFSDHHLSCNYFFTYRRHTIFAGPLLGIRIFSMGYQWERLIYGFNLAYLFKISKYFHFGTEFLLYKIEGSALTETRLSLLPAFRF